MTSLNSKYTFERFVVGPCNDFAQAAAIATAKAPAKNYNPLFIYGGTGLGKTHLLHAIGLMIAASQPEGRVIYVSAAALTTELINAIRTDRMSLFKEKYRNAGCLLVDDVHDLSGKDRTQEELFHVFNTLHDSGRQVVFAGSKFPKDIPHMEERLRSRFLWGLIADVKPPDLETRTAIIKRKIQDSKTVISDEAANYIAALVTSNIGELEGFLNQVSAYAALTGSDISCDLVKIVLTMHSIKGLPHNPEAEQSILGSILRDNNSIKTALKIISIRDFYNESHRKIFRIMIDLADKEAAIDLGTLSNVLKEKGLLDSVGGTSYLTFLMENISSTLNVTASAEIIKDSASRRELICASENIFSNCNVKNADADAVLERAENEIYEISENRVKPCFYSTKTIVLEKIQEIENLFARKELITGVPTGFEIFDDMTSGLQNSDLIIIAGRPGMGKTTFALNIAQFAAMECKIPVAYFSLHEANDEIAFRLLACESRIDAQRLRKGFLCETDWPKLKRASEHLSDALLYIDDTQALSFPKMAARARRLKADFGLGLIIVDYIQLMQADNHESKMFDICHSLKAFAKEVKVPIVAISKLSSNTKDRCDHRPQMDDLQDTDVFEQEADVIAFIYRDEVYNKSADNPEKDIAEIIIAKHRNGPTGTVKLKFTGKFMCFDNPKRVEITP